MKKIIFSLLLFLPSHLLFSQHIPSSQLTQYGKIAFMQKSNLNVQNVDDVQVKSFGFMVDETTQDTLIMILNFENTGFIIISADESAFPVLAYSLDEEYSLDAPAPGSRFFLDIYADEIKAIKSGDREPDASTADAWTKIKERHPVSSKSTPNDYLITSRWNQNKFYNEYSPKDPDSPSGYDNRVPNGCVAVAMAQILYYYRFPEVGRGSHTNYTDYGNFHVNFSQQHYNYGSMLDALSVWNNEVAKLIFHCATSVDMMYAPEGSGAYSQDVPDALKIYFKYSTDARQIWKGDSEQGNISWRATIANQIAQKRPVYYSGCNEGGCHAFICDGYDGEEYFHFNLGWGGSGNGYYLINNESTSSGGYPYGQSAIIDIYPSGDYPLYCQAVSEPLTSSTGTLEDGSNGEDYQNNSSCTYIIAPPNATSFDIQIQHLDTEEDADILSFWTGDPENGGELHSTYSGSLSNYIFRIDSDVVYITFNTNSSVTASGWRIIYNVTNFPHCSQKNFRDNSGTFTDGSEADENYWPSQNCIWLIFPLEAQETEYIALSFPKFDLSAEDEVIVTDLTVGSDIQHLYRGNDIPQEVIYYTKRLKIEFRSDNYLENTGFKASWRTNLAPEEEPDSDINNELSLISGISLYPIPAVDYYKIQFPASLTGDWNLTMYDIAGRALLSEKISVESGQRYQVDISDFPSGFYLVKLQNRSNEFSKKLMISK